MSEPSKNTPSKHPSEMTTDEAIKHLFHPEAVDHVQKRALSEQAQKIASLKKD